MSEADARPADPCPAGRLLHAGWSAALAAITGRELTAELLGQAARSARPFRPSGVPHPSATGGRR